MRQLIGLLFRLLHIIYCVTYHLRHNGVNYVLILKTGVNYVLERPSNSWLLQFLNSSLISIKEPYWIKKSIRFSEAAVKLVLVVSMEHDCPSTATYPYGLDIISCFLVNSGFIYRSSGKI